MTEKALELDGSGSLGFFRTRSTLVGFRILICRNNNSISLRLFSHISTSPGGYDVSRFFHKPNSLDKGLHGGVLEHLRPILPERKSPLIYRHGDVILRQVPSLPKQFNILSEKPSCVLAEGESTGHKHLLSATQGDVLVIRAFSTDDDRASERFIKLEAPAMLTHEEHHTLTIDTGLYEVIQEKEYDFLEHAKIKAID